jgi:protein TonB
MNLHSLHAERPRDDSGAEPLAAASLPPPATPEPAFTERSVYAPPASGRIVGLIGTGMVYAAIGAGFFFVTFTYIAPSKAPSALAVFDVRPPASPPETPPKEKEAPRPVQKKEKPPEPQPARPVEPTKIAISPVTVPIPVAVPRPADPGPREPETAAPKTLPAPPAPQVASNAADTWEGRVLSQLMKNRRYPSWAMSRREQGIPYVRILMNREGKVLSVRLERSSGFPELDREAVALPKRASPLPKPPDDKPGDPLELVVPVEFFVRVRP